MGLARSVLGLVLVALLAVAVWALAEPWTAEPNNALYWVGCAPIAVLGGALLRHGMQFAVGPTMSLAQFAHYLLFTERDQNLILVTVAYTMTVWTVVSVLACAEMVRNRRSAAT